MRWKTMVLTLAVAVATVAGCAQRTFLTEQQFKEFHLANNLPCDLDRNPHLGVDPLTGPIPPPSTVDFPERPPRYMALSECLAIALENGTTGFQSIRQLGIDNQDLLAVNPGNGVPLITGSDSIRVLSLSPAIAGLAIEAGLARFDAKFVTSIKTGTTDQPIQGINSFNNGDTGALTSTLVQQLPTGGLAGLTFNTNYQNLSRPPTGFTLLNPAWSSRAQVTFEQPLWQGYGVDINQILARPVSLGTQLSQIDPNATSFVNSQISNLANQGTTGSNLAFQGILVARVRFDQSRADLERVVNFSLVNTEVAYWNLYGSYVNLYSSEQALRQAYEAWRISKAKYEAGSIAVTQYAQTRGQYEQFRGDRIVALGQVLENERVLRALIGLPVEDGHRIVPVDAPTLAPYLPDWDTALHEALTLRPELVAARAELKTLQFNLMVFQNFLKPDLRFVSDYGLNALGTRLDGNSQFLDASTGAFQSLNDLRVLSSGHYGDWSLGLILNVPIGYRFENAAVRQARLQLAQGFHAVKREEEKARQFLAKTYRDVVQKYKEIEARRAQRVAFAEQVEARFKEFIAGKTTADFLLEAQRQWANSLSTEYQAIVSYNNALATFEFAKGTIMDHDNIHIAEGPLPKCLIGRAVEHERERSLALAVRQVEDPVQHTTCHPDEISADLAKENISAPALPRLSPAEAPKLPSLLQGAPKLEKFEELPTPTPAPKGAGSDAKQAFRPTTPATIAASQPVELPLPTPLPNAGAPASAPAQTGPNQAARWELPAAPLPVSTPAIPAATTASPTLPLPTALPADGKLSGSPWPN